MKQMAVEWTKRGRGERDVYMYIPCWDLQCRLARPIALVVALAGPTLEGHVEGEDERIVVRVTLLIEGSSWGVYDGCISGRLMVFRCKRSNLLVGRQ